MSWQDFDDHLDDWSNCSLTDKALLLPVLLFALLGVAIWGLFDLICPPEDDEDD